MRILSYLIPLVMLLTACSSEKPQQQEASSAPPSETSQLEADRTIHIIGIDQMKFIVKEEGKGISTEGSMTAFNGEKYLLLKTIEAEPGEVLRIRLTTLSQLKPKMMSHNWVLLKKDADPQEFANAATRKNDFIPPDKKENIVAHTDLAGDGETVEVVFTVPEETGRYDYLCSFMAHFAAGMRGQLVVK